MSDGGKGSAPRPYSVAHDEWVKRWDAIFNRDLQNTETKDDSVNEQKENESK